MHDGNRYAGKNENQKKDINSVAIKILDKTKISQNEIRMKQLVSEIRVHWAIEKCEGLIRILELYDDESFIYIVLEY